MFFLGGAAIPQRRLVVQEQQYVSHDFFDFFELDRKLGIDGAHLQKRFYELSRKWHPDRFTRATAAEQEAALEATSILNDGYRTLKDPVKRAEYLLTQEGFPIGEQRSRDVPPELLEEVFELNMLLEELRTGDESQRPELEQAGENFRQMRAKIDRELENLFVKYDSAAPEGESSKQALHEIRGVLNRRRYIENLIRDVDRALKPASEPVGPEL
jgi:molecular chaperone HscB